MYRYNESVHHTHVWITPNASTHDIIEKEWTYVNWMVLEIILQFHGLPTMHNKTLQSNL